MGTVLIGFIFNGICMTLIAIVSILTMIFGWGLEAKSWGWIILGYIVTMMISFAMGAITSIITE